MSALRDPDGEPLSIARGIRLEDEPGLGPLTIPGYLREVTQRHRGREALVLRRPDGSRIAWSYDELWTHSLAVAKALIAVDVGKGTRVGVLMANRPEYLSALFGIALAGGIAVSLSTFSTPSELADLLRSSSVSLLLYDRQVLKTDFGHALCELEPAIDTCAPGQLTSVRLPFLRRLVALCQVTDGRAGPRADGAAVEDWAPFLERGRPVQEQVVLSRAAAVGPADPFGLFFSSGTTNAPKAILHSHRAFAIQWWRWPRVLEVHGPARAWTGNGFFWSGNIAMVVGCALSTGGAVILQPTFEAAAALSLLQSEKVTLMNGRPHQWARLQATPGWAEADLSCVSHVTRGEIIRSHPTVHSTWERPNSFGTTETMTILSAFTTETPRERKAGSFGTPLPGNTIKIVDPQTGEILKRPLKGEICVKGPTLMLGYCGKVPEETFDEEGYFHTGDGGYLDSEDRLYFQGRLDHMIKTGGANVSPEEVDAVIASYPGVRRTQTVGVAHETLSEMVVACIVAEAGEVLSEGALLAHLRRHLAAFKVPRRILFFDEAEFALTGNEKAQVQSLKQLAAQRLAADPQGGSPA